jgi:NTP pyrophosphatase (non-canonical NTP hydrolase)
MKDITYYIYHIPGKKIGVTTNLKSRVEDQQGYGPGEYEILARRYDISEAAKYEALYQRMYGYPVDIVPYDKLNCNKNKLNMNINVTEQTTTFPCPVNKLKGQLMDNLGMKWHTDHGTFTINEYSIKWIMKNVKTSMFNKQRSYIYNKAFSRFYDNHQSHDYLGGNLADAHMRERYPSNGHETRTGGLAPTGMKEQLYECCDENNPCTCKPQFSKKINKYLEPSQFDLIRDWASERGLYDKGDPKTQTLKLMEEAGEICRAVLKDNRDDVIDGIGDCVVVLTNLAELIDMSIEDCIEVAYAEISNRTGKMVNGTFKKD